MLRMFEMKRLSMRFDAPVTGAAATAAAFVFACGDGAFWRIAANEQRLDGHDGVSLALASTMETVLSAGDDGRLLEIGDGGVREIVRLKGWINGVAAAPETGLMAAAAGRRVHVFDRRRTEVAAFDHPSTVAAVAFDPKGKKVVAAHYGGVSVWMAGSATATRRTYDWKGSHVGVLWSPCGRFIVTTMQENAIHGWRIEDGADFRMDGYPMRVKSAAFVDRGRTLATTGAGADILLWPFVGPKGPMGKNADVLSAQDDHVVTIVASRPRTASFAAGSDDGAVRVFDVETGEGVTVAEANGAAASALAWSPDGRMLAVGRADGSAEILTVSPA